MITWNTDVSAPCCPGEILAEDGRSVLVQTDWDYPGVARSFGWNMAEVQPDSEGYFDRFDIAEAWHLALAHCHGGQHSREYERLSRMIRYFKPRPNLSVETLSDNARAIYHGACAKLLGHGCDHSGTDGTIDCPDCGLTATDFITAASNWLAEHDGATAEDPGYFD